MSQDQSPISRSNDFSRFGPERLKSLLRIPNLFLKSCTSYRRPFDKLRAPLLFIFLLAFLPLFVLLLNDAHAEEGALVAGTSPAPLSGAEAVSFISQAVDGTLSRAQDGSYWVDAQGAVRLHNTDRFNAANIRLGWPGWPGGNLHFDLNQLFNFTPLKDGARIGTQVQTLSTAWLGEERESQWLVGQIQIAPDTRQRLYFNWRQPLGSDVLLTYSFGLLPARAWVGNVGSARITLKLPNFSSQEMIVEAQPADYTFSGDKIEWISVNQEPRINPSVTFIAPHIWQEIEKTRAERATDPLNANLRLASLYEQLVAAGVSLYEGEIEGTLQAAHQAAPDDPEPLRRLAELYRARAKQEPDNLALLEQAVMTSEAAVAAGATDEDMRSGLVRNLQTLAHLWREKDATIAFDFLKRAEAAGAEASAIEKQRAQLAESVVLAELARNDFPAALKVAAKYGLPTAIATAPWLTSNAIHIENTPGERTISLFAHGDDAILSQRISELSTQLNELGYPSRWDADTNTLTMRFRGEQEAWLEAGANVASLLSNAPEWDLLRDVLTTASIQYQVAEDNLQQSNYTYREQVQVESRAADIANQIRQEAATRQSAWEERLLNQSASHWQTLADSQTLRITTRFDVEGQMTQRQWHLTLPAKQTLEWTGDIAHHQNWPWTAAAVALGLLLLLGLIWLPGWRWRARGQPEEPGKAGVETLG